MAYQYYPNTQYSWGIQQPAMQMPQQSYIPAPNPYGIQWVDGEVGARAFQVPGGIQPGTTIALWDMNEPYIYLRSVNQAGMPLPLRKIPYDPNFGPQEQQALPVSGSVAPAQDYVSKQDFESFRNEIRQMMQHNQNQQGNQQNRGGQK